MKLQPEAGMADECKGGQDSSTGVDKREISLHTLLQVLLSLSLQPHFASTVSPFSLGSTQVV